MIVEAKTEFKLKPRLPQAFDLQNFVDSRLWLSTQAWRKEFDTELKYFTREYMLKERITSFRYGIKKDDTGAPLWVYMPSNPKESALVSFMRGRDVVVGSESLSLRAAAECIGFVKIEQEIVEDKGKNRFYIWHSPPGLKSDGFDTHNFTFIGYVGEEDIEVVAYKNWLSLERMATFFNQLLSKDEPVRKDDPFSYRKLRLSTGWEDVINNPTDIEFLKNPVFLDRNCGFKSYLDIIHALDPQGSDDIGHQDSRVFLEALEPFRRAIINAVNGGNLSEARRNKIAHDNYALAWLKDKTSGITDIYYWSTLPAVALRGSCGFSGISEFRGMWFWVNEQYFDCPKCDKKIESGKGITTCPHCGARKEDYNRCA